ncbi:MAG: OmpH/Skp family outer membrane protein [Planctomycetota bacterium]|jgi:Skp family chaperone for outer membrane proteins
MRNSLSLPVAILLLALVGVVSVQSYALGRAAPSPTAVATVNLEAVFEGLAERADADETLTRMAEGLQAEMDDQTGAITLLEEEVEAYPVESQKHQEALAKLQLASLEHQAFVEFSRRKVDIQKALVLKRLYLTIKEASAIMAMELGYDIIFVDDSLAELPDGTETDVRRQISARRMLFASPEIDVTADLVARMNESFARSR